MSFTMTLKDVIAPKPATWIEELFWGRRHTVSLSAGTAGSVALYSLYFDQRDRVLRLARDFSLLIAAFADADHLRIEEITPAGASRRPSRVRAGGETVTLPIAATEGPQMLKVRFSYFSGRVAWRPILVSVLPPGPRQPDGRVHVRPGALAVSSAGVSTSPTIWAVPCKTAGNSKTQQHATAVH